MVAVHTFSHVQATRDMKLEEKGMLVKLICFYNFFALVLSISSGFQTTNITRFSWDYFVFIVFPLFIQLISTVGMWYVKGWAFTLQIFFYLFQAISYKDPEMSYSFILGPHFFINLNINFPTGQVIIGFNALSIGILILLIAAMVKTQER